MSNGVINAFTKEGQKLFGTYHDTAKEYYQNAVTCMDVHPKRPDYLIAGYNGGQLVLIDTTAFSKSVKKMSDHHNKSPVVAVKFCDWIKERNIKDVLQQNKNTHGSINKKEDK